MFIVFILGCVTGFVVASFMFIIYLQLSIEKNLGIEVYHGRYFKLVAVERKESRRHRRKDNYVIVHTNKHNRQF